MANKRPETSTVHVCSLLGVGAVIALSVAFALSSYFEYQRKVCDLKAAAYASHLSAIMERFGHHRADPGKPGDWMSIATGLVFPGDGSYPLTSESHGCRLRVRLTDNEAWTCAVKGRKTGRYWHERHIYRLSLPSGRTLPPTTGTCNGPPQTSLHAWPAHVSVTARSSLRPHLHRFP
jgi:hypothetical protein